MIPTYRAKKIYSDEYVEGFYSESGDKKHLIFALKRLDDGIISAVSYRWWEEIDPSTLAIHFPDTEGWYSTSLITRLVQNMEETES